MTGKSDPVTAQSAEDKPYYAGIDIIKILAAFFVVCIHFFLRSGFYDAPLSDTRYVPFLAVRFLVYNCVPLFMISTGFLMKNKRFSAGYYKGLIRVVVIYVFISLLCIRFNTVQLDMVYTKWDILRGMLMYTNDSYAWYVNYYLSLFFIIPFLNSAFNGLRTQRERLALVISVTMITVAARSFFIGFAPEKQSAVLPYYLSDMWPLAYYFVGAYIREYPPVKERYKIKLLAFIIMLTALCFVTWSTLEQSLDNAENGQKFTSRHFDTDGNGSYPVFIMSVCIFILLFDIKVNNRGARFVLRHVGETTLALYLISFIFDTKNYFGLDPERKTLHQRLFFFLYDDGSIGFNEKYPDIYTRCTHCYEIIFKNFFSSLFWALVITNGYKLFVYCFKRLTDAVRSKNAAAKNNDT